MAAWLWGGRAGCPRAGELLGWVDLQSGRAGSGFFASGFAPGFLSAQAFAHDQDLRTPALAFALSVTDSSSYFFSAASWSFALSWGSFSLALGTSVAAPPRRYGALAFFS